MLPLNDSGDQHSIKCDVCQSGYHQRCTGIAAKTLDALIKKMYTGWVCEDCREFVRSRSQSLQSAMTALTEELATVKTELIEIKQQAVFATVSPIQQSPNTPLADEIAATKAELTDLKQ
jgi:PHD-finger